MALRASLTALTGRALGSRGRSFAAGVVVIVLAGSLAGCTDQPGAALVVDGESVSEVSVQQAASAFLAQNAAATITVAQAASVNRAQITFEVRHALIAKAVSDKHIVITAEELKATGAAVKARGAGAGLAAQLELPRSQDAAVLYDVVAVEAMIKAFPAGGVPVLNVSVTAEGVPATTRDQAVELRSQFLADPTGMDAAVTAAAGNGIAKRVYNLVQAPRAGTAGLYQASSGGVVIYPNPSGYLVLRSSGRSVISTNLTEASFSSLTGLPSVFDIAALLLAGYQASAGISVNPRYGVWDPATVQVVPGNDGL